MTTALRRQETTVKRLQYNFSNEELVAIGKELAENNNSLSQLDADKKRVVSDFTARITEKNSRIELLSRNISNGYDFRDVKCTIQYHYPTTGIKSITRDDTGEVVEKVAMTLEECQEHLYLEDDAEDAQIIEA